MPYDEKTEEITVLVPLSPQKAYFERNLAIKPPRAINARVLQGLLQCSHFREVLDYCLDLYESSYPGTKRALFDNLGAAGPDPGFLALLDNPDVAAILREIKDNPGLEKALIYQLNFFKEPATV